MVMSRLSSKGLVYSVLLHGDNCSPLLKDETDVDHTHVVRNQSGQEKFENVKEKIRNQLFQIEMAKQTKQWLMDMRTKAHILKL